VALVYAHLSGSFGLNDVCDSLRLAGSHLNRVRGATAPCRNTFSHANRTRDPRMAESLLWGLINHLGQNAPGFTVGTGRLGRGLGHRFRRKLHIVDATVIELVANCLPWAKHRRRKAAAKLHMRVDFHSQLPQMAVVDTAKEADCTRAAEVCAGVRAGEVVIFDRAYVDFEHLWALAQRGVFWVTRQKERMVWHVVEARPKSEDSRVLSDQIVESGTHKSRGLYPGHLRRVTALVEVDGTLQKMVFLTNNLTWSASSVIDLYRCRWQIEAFFKQIKQMLKLGDFLGHNANAVRWQIFAALIAYVLLRFQAFASPWAGAFSRLFTLVRAALWRFWDLVALLRSCGTAGGSFRILGAPRQAYLPGLEIFSHGTAS
jgi:hypothetical protein